jgi:hypothetical protein
MQDVTPISWWTGRGIVSLSSKKRLIRYGSSMCSPVEFILLFERSEF